MSDIKNLAPALIESVETQVCLRSPKHSEYKTFKKLNSITSKSAGQKFYLISSRWYEDWINYLSSSSTHPGEILTKDLINLATSSSHYTHKSPSHLYANQILNNGLIEERDFIICTEKSYEYLKSIYSYQGPEIIRFSIDLGDSISIEINLKSLNLDFYPSINKKSFESKSLYISHTDKVSTVKSLIQDLISSSFDNSELSRSKMRLWKMHKDCQLERLNGLILTPGCILDDSLTIENCQITNEDFIIIEHSRKSGEWCLAKREKTKKVSDFSYPTGLQNLGNTCYMNSALQCVSATDFLKSFFLNSNYLRDLNTNNPLGSKNAELAKTFADLMQDLWKGGHSSLSPWGFKKVIAKQAAQFSGYYQHDSHELLSYLLTGLHEDLNRVKVKTYTEMPEINTDMDDDQVAKVHWEWFQRRNQSVIIDNMFGQYKSKLCCPDCNKISITFDPALSFTVCMPKIDIKKITISVVSYDLSKPIFRILVTVLGSWDIRKLKEILYIKYGENFEIAVYNKGNFYCMTEDHMELSDFFYKHLYAYVDKGEDGIYVPILISKSGEKRFFGTGEKTTVSFPRVIKLPLSSTPREIYEKLSERFNNLKVQNSFTSTPFILNYVNTSKVVEGYIFNSQLPCDFCKRKCKNCPIDLNSEITLSELQSNRKNSEGVLKLEMEWNSEAKSLTMLNRFEDVNTHIIPEETKITENYSLISCLEKSAAVEKLDENNMWYCSNCKKHVQALRTYQMYSAPKYLILHFMRFKSRFQSSEKNSIFVDFPVSGLDLSGIVLSSKKPEVYDLYAVSNHFGGTSGGHYTAFVKNEGNWYEMDDSHAIPISESKVVSDSAYVLFYKERV